MVDGGKWNMGDGIWEMEYGKRGDGIWGMEYGIWNMGSGKFLSECSID